MARINGSELIYAIREATQDLRGPGKVLLALDVKASSAHQVRMWSERLADPSLTFKVIAHPSNQQVGAPGSFSVDTEPDGTYVVVVDPLHTELVGKEVHGQKGPTLPAESLGEPNERRWLLWFDADGAPNRVELSPDLTD